MTYNFNRTSKEVELLKDIHEQIDLISLDTVKYSEEVIRQIKNNAELKSLKDSRNKLISKKDGYEGNFKQLRKDIDHLKREQMLTPVKSVKTPRNSLFSFTKIKLFEQMTNLEIDASDNVQTLTDIDQDSIIDELETKISILKKENTEFFVFVDELNDTSYRVEAQNSSLKSELKSIEKQLNEITKERNNLRKLYLKQFPNASNFEPKANDMNLDYLDNASKFNLSADIVSYLNK